MRHARVYGVVGLAALAAVAAAFAQTTVTPLPDNEPVQAMPLDANIVASVAEADWGDAEAGVVKAAPCAACHGVDGNPVDPQYPRIAGHSEHYIAQQLALYKSGQRTGGMAGVMAPFAMPLSAQDMRDIGAYFATQTAGAGIADDSIITTGPYAEMMFYEVGEQLFRAGDPERGLPACMACHGPAGAGNPGPPYPHIAGQQSAYVARRLQEYRTGTTTLRDPAQFNIMASVAESLTDIEIDALASYLQGLHARPDPETRAAMREAQQNAPAPAPAPAPATPPQDPAPADAPAQG